MAGATLLTSDSPSSPSASMLERACGMSTTSIPAASPLTGLLLDRRRPWQALVT